MEMLKCALLYITHKFKLNNIELKNELSSYDVKIYKNKKNTYEGSGIDKYFEAKNIDFKNLYALRNMLDVEFLKKYHKSLVNILLYDNTTEKNIVWGTDDYLTTSNKYSFSSNIMPDSVNIIKPRRLKDVDICKDRSAKMAEVFTPAWICNKQNNILDKEILPSDFFNKESENGWVTTIRKDRLSDEIINKYISSPRIEITCGEAPYITSRFDAVDGRYIELYDRIGLLDRKLRIVTEYFDKNNWYDTAIIALKSIYGYEYQGDNLFLARCNIFFTFIEYYFNVFYKLPELNKLIEIANIISLNIVQMDGMNLSSLDGSKKVSICDWETEKEILFESVLNNE